MNMGVVGYNGDITMTFASRIIGRDLQREFSEYCGLGLKVTIETNELEV